MEMNIVLVIISVGLNVIAISFLGIVSFILKKYIGKVDNIEYECPVRMDELKTNYKDRFDDMHKILTEIKVDLSSIKTCLNIKKNQKL